MSGTLALGRQPIDLSVYARVAAHEAKLQEGVVRMDGGLAARLPLCRGCGVKTRLARDGSLQIAVSVVVRYGADLNALSASIQEAVLRGVGRISDRPVGSVNVHITGFEVPKPERRFYERGAVS